MLSKCEAEENGGDDDEDAGGEGVGNTSAWMPLGFLENCKSGKLSWLKQSIT